MEATLKMAKIFLNRYNQKQGIEDEESDLDWLEL